MRAASASRASEKTVAKMVFSNLPVVDEAASATMWSDAAVAAA